MKHIFKLFTYLYKIALGSLVPSNKRRYGYFIICALALCLFFKASCMPILPQVLTYINTNTEVLNLGPLHIFSIISVLLLTYILNSIKSYRVFKDNIKFETSIYVGFLVLVILLNLMDNFRVVFYIVYFVSVLLYTMLSKCNVQTKLCFLIIFNICYFTSTQLHPFLSIQKNEVWVYVLVILCLCVLFLCYNNVFPVVLILLFLLCLNFCIIGFYCMICSIDMSLLPLYIKFLFTVLYVLVYMFILLLYVFLTHFYYEKEFQAFCNRLDCISKIRFLIVSLSIIVLSLCIRNIYIYNIAVFQILESCDLVVLLIGTKNPHHEWMCGPGLKHIFGAHCRKMSTMLIYKQKQQTEIKELYEEIRNLAVLQNDKKKVAELTESKTNLKKDPFNHFGCLVTKDDGSKVNTFITHGKLVDKKPTLLFDESDPNERMSSTGVRVDQEYEKNYLSDIANMRTADTDKLNQKLATNKSEYNDHIVDSIIDSDETMSSLWKKTEIKVERYKQQIDTIKQENNDRNNEVD